MLDPSWEYQEYREYIEDATLRYRLSKASLGDSWYQSTLFQFSISIEIAMEVNNARAL